MVMFAEEQAAKRINVRRAHSATRFTGQIEDAVESGDVRRLKQLKQSLTNKLTVLTKLDDKVLELTEDDDLDAEVKQADDVREKIDLAVLTIEDVLQAHIQSVSQR